MNIIKSRISIAQINKRHIVAIVYILLLVCGLSFYMPNGYLTIGDDKYAAYKWINYIGIPTWFLAALYDSFKNKNTALVFKFKELIINHLWVLLFAFAAVISTLTSYYREISLYGHNGWYMGMWTMLSMVMIYFIMYDLVCGIGREYTKYLVYFVLFVSSIVFLLGILNRFSFFPIKIDGHEEEFTSTIGNINWYCGYLAIWLGIGCGIFLKSKGQIKIRIAAVFLWICAMAGVASGASSAYIIWAAVSFVSFLMAMCDTEYVRQWAIMEMLMAITLPLTRIAGFFRPFRMWYLTDWMLGITYGNSWIVPFGLMTVMCVVVTLLSEWICRHAREIRIVLCGLLFGSFLIAIILLFMNTKIRGGIWPVRGVNLFFFDDNWGTGRGAIWKASIEIIKNMSVFSMLFGVGCDCYSQYAYQIEPAAIIIQRNLADTILTNAHNELLTMLINEGLFGVIVYIGLFVSQIKRTITKNTSTNWSENGIIWGIVLSTIAYLALGITGFMHILATPFLFMIWGILAGLTNPNTLNTIR